MATPETKLFINGEFVPSVSGKTFPIFNPTTEEKITDVFEADAADVDAAVTAAENAFPAWKSLSAHDRINKCLKFAELIERDQFEIAKLDAENIGMPVSVNHLFIQRAIRDIKHTSGLAHDPYGVCAAILAWNAPVVIFTAKVIPCIVAGNTIIVKSSEKAPLSSLKLGALAAEAGFPPGVINVLSGFGHTVGAALSSHMKIRKLTFTGSTRAGKLIQEAAAKSNLKSVALEMGGKNPLIVFPDCDIEETAGSAAASLKFNSGQICVSNSRIYVHKDIFQKFLKAFSEKFVETKFGSPLEPTTFFGPQADKLQFDQISKFIEQAKSAGANLVTGGSRATSKGYYIQPTVFAQVPANAEILHEEIFGPVAVVQEFETEYEVIAECNKTEYGLHAGLYTRDISRACRVATALETGVVTVNSGGSVGAYDMPFGGWKQSGNGRELGKLGLEEFYEIKTVIITL
ncbi:aldehyde dehydrogenase family domain-containing protein [Trichoderma breve]|uniref:aldehyde dehydrogenase (NAD(+)) n=1 Tax=Trichoderma breve TaxID=2034170 RepID=A0A9W9BEX1_9HYPO|nr:aldehyde dehydrogenase family domain-containing protein [Trichoderma breve]KAJ4862058.1 aldehyde dehydrogenase family domain-containing protein [Trichoderma breve]